MPFKTGHKINSGKHFSEETRKKMSDAHKGWSPMQGHKHSDETKNKMSLTKIKVKDT